MQRNVVLIRELNENLTKVGDLYEELSGAFMQRVSSAQSVNPENRNNGDEAGWETCRARGGVNGASTARARMRASDAAKRESVGPNAKERAKEGECILCGECTRRAR